MLRNAWLAYFPDRLLLGRNRLNELIQIAVKDAESTAHLDRRQLSRMAPNPNRVLSHARDGGHFPERIVLSSSYVHRLSPATKDGSKHISRCDIVNLLFLNFLQVVTEKTLA